MAQSLRNSPLLTTGLLGSPKGAQSVRLLLVITNALGKLFHSAAVSERSLGCVVEGTSLHWDISSRTPPVDSCYSLRLCTNSVPVCKVHTEYTGPMWRRAKFSMLTLKREKDTEHTHCSPKMAKLPYPGKTTSSLFQI